ncbi:MAG: sulfatase family protein [Gammaproteobacteria bacterium]
MPAAGAILALVLLPAALAAADSRPNLILIVADNQAASLLGPYGNEEIRTPNIDRLAQEGMTFVNAFAANGVCSPSRATLLTGLIPSQTGIHVALQAGTDTEGWSAIEEFRSLPQTLADAGYATGLIGKYHLGNHDEPQLGFRDWVTFTSGHTTAFHDVSVIDNGERYVVEEHLTDFWTRKALTFLERQDGDEPFFLYLAYNGPYMLPPTVTMDVPNRHTDYYRANRPSFPQQPVHPYLRRWTQMRAPSQTMVNEGTTAWTAIGALNNPTAMINTAAETSMVDDGVGQVMDALERLGLDDNTLVIYTSDQGASYGQHGLWGNTSWSFPFTAFDVNMHIPLILRHPGNIDAGARNSRIIAQYDMLPTLLQYLGLEQQRVDNSPGQSFVPLLESRSVDWHDEAFFEFVTVRVLRTPRWKFMKRFDREEPDTLFDMVNDPDETRNLIDDPAHADTIARLDRRLQTFFDRYADPRFDLWNGGTAKGRLLEVHYGKDHIFSDRFPDWQPPFVARETPFSDRN